MKPFMKSPTTEVFLDTEFTDLNQSSKLISLALVSDCGKSFYAVFDDFNKAELSDFVKENVTPYLNFSEDNCSLINYRIKGNSRQIQLALINWLSQFENIQIWADVPHYDWVLFCELFGGALQIPKQIHYICMDLATLILSKGMDINKPRIELLTREEIPNNYIIHNALSDAEVGMQILNKLLNQ